MTEQIEKLAQFVAETQWEDIPRAVQSHAKLVLLDTFGVILAGAEQPEVRRLQERPSGHPWSACVLRRACGERPSGHCDAALQRAVRAVGLGGGRHAPMLGATCFTRVRSA